MTLQIGQPVPRTMSPEQQRTILGRICDPGAAGEETQELADTTMEALANLDSVDRKTLEAWFGHVTQNEYNYALTLIAMHQLLASDLIEGEVALKRLVTIETHDLPSFSNILAWQYLKKIVELLSNGYLKSIQTFEELKNEFSKFDSSKMMNRVAFYLIAASHFKDNKEQLKITSLSLNEFSLQNSREMHFPKAETSNDQLINPLMNLLIYLWTSSSLNLDLGESLVSYLKNSYHNSRVVQLLCLNSVKQNHRKECLAQFQTYIDYTNDFKIKHKGVYDDLVGCIETYCIVLDYLSKTLESMDDYRTLYRYNEQLNKILSKYLINQVKPESNQHILELQNFLSFVYTKQSDIYENCFSYSSLSIEEQILKMIELTAKAIKSVDQNKTVNQKRLAYNYYKNSYYCHKNGQDDLAIKRIKKALTNDPNNVDYLLFLIKLYTGDEETFELALSLTQQLLESSLKSGFGSSLKARKQVAETYLIFLTLLGPEAESYLSDLFITLNDLFNNKFSDVKIKTKEQTKQRTSAKNQLQTYNDLCSPCDSPGRTKRFLNKLKSPISSSHSPKTTSRSSEGTIKSSSAHQSHPKSQTAVPDDESLAVHDILLDLSRLFQSLDMLDSSLESVELALEIYPASAYALARQGCVLLALEESERASRCFEKSLETGTTVAEAALGIFALKKSPASQQRAQMLAQHLVGSGVAFHRDGQLLYQIGLLSRASRAWTGVKIL